MASTQGRSKDTDIDYDPHQHRVVTNPTSYSESMMHLLKGCVGAGILAMPDSFKRMGLIGAPIGVVVICTFATYCIHMLMTVQYILCKRSRVGYMTYSESIKAALESGPPHLRGTAACFGYGVNAMLIIWQLGLCCVYNVFVAENIKQVCDVYGFQISLRLHILICFVPILLLNMVKSLKLLSPMSTISNGVTMLGFLLVFWYLLEKDVIIQSNMLKAKGLIDVPVFVGVVLFSFMAPGVILALEFNMENPKQFPSLFNIAMAIILALYSVVGFFGYLKYGEVIKASITLNLPNEEKKAQACKIMLAIAIAMSHPLQNFVAYDLIWIKLSEKYEGKKKVIVDYTLRVVLVVIPATAAIAVPTLGPTISLVGALCLSLLAIVFPALMDLCVCYPNEYGSVKYKLIRDIVIIILGMLALVSGVYTSILEMMVLMRS